MWFVGFEGEEKVVEVEVEVEVEEFVVFVIERRDLPWIVLGIFFLRSPPRCLFSSSN